ncbi:hypothetical protein CYMTET_53669 [Cymbomonas tetramitiformis]|uniref:GSCFA domain-containing protein n=1 Tax=Cymbomonas tetramitiformis TaxID=36881 RepID=A0AAE0BGL0_9CHLO|nr:hypothetical protein CYMTET_53669 [Cymbomonas tetramitiformis]
MGKPLDLDISGRGLCKMWKAALCTRLSFQRPFPVEYESHTLTRTFLKKYRCMQRERRSSLGLKVWRAAITTRRHFSVFPSARMKSRQANEQLFRTEVPVKPFERQLEIGHQAVFLGSCFADYFGNHFAGLKFKVDVNPFGIVFNPRSLSTALQRLCSQDLSGPSGLYTAESLLQVDARWCSLDHHSSFNKRTPEETLEAINSRLLIGRRALQSADHLVLTLGSAWVYETLSEDCRIVANCHKLPAARFQKRILTVDEMIQDLVSAITKVCAARDTPPQVVLTVSPVRHWKDGAVENSLSKASLLVATHEVLRQLQMRSLGQMRAAWDRCARSGTDASPGTDASLWDRCVAPPGTDARRSGTDAPPGTPGTDAPAWDGCAPPWDGCVAAWEHRCAPPGTDAPAWDRCAPLWDRCAARWDRCARRLGQMRTPGDQDARRLGRMRSPVGQMRPPGTDARPPG